MKLNKLNSQKLTEKEMNNLRGGAQVKCGCGCASENAGGSNAYNNAMANSKSGLTSPGAIKIEVVDGKIQLPPSKEEPNRWIFI